MSEQAIFYTILTILLADFVLERVVSYLNLKSSTKAIPTELEGVYDTARYRKSQDYQATLSRFSNLTATFFFVLVFLAVYRGWFGMLDAWLRNFSPMDMLTTLYFFAALYLIHDVLGLPFDLYRTFVIEERFGFNKTSAKTYILDKVKGYLLAILIGGLLLVALVYLISAMGHGFWLYFWGVMTAFILLANLFYTSLILPLFNKLVPMEAGELKASIEAFSQQVNFPLKNIFVIDGSKRSSKGNAFFSGLGNKKKVVLYDTLIDKHTTEELTAIFAHEVGHYKKKHIYLSTALGIMQMGIMLFLLSRMIYHSEVSYALGGNMTAIHLNILAFGILYTPISHLLGLGMNLISRKNEYEADAYAAQHYQTQPLIDALKKLSGDHLSNLTPHPLYVFLNYSHPTLLQRIRAMRKINVSAKD